MPRRPKKPSPRAIGHHWQVYLDSLKGLFPPACKPIQETVTNDTAKTIFIKADAYEQAVIARADLSRRKLLGDKDIFKEERHAKRTKRAKD